MGHFVLKNAAILFDGYDLSGDSNRLLLNLSAAELDDSTFGSDWERKLQGLKSARFTAEGKRTIGLANSEGVLFTNLGVADRIVTLAADGGDVGEVGYIFRSLPTSYTLDDTHGEIAPFAVDGAGSGDAGRGLILHDRSTARTSSSSGSAVQVGAASSDQRLYAALHVLSVSGTASPTLTVKVQSDNASNFPSATDQITFAATTAVGAEWKELAGPNTDDYYRVSWTISGTNPSFLFVVTLAVQ